MGGRIEPIGHWPLTGREEELEFIRAQLAADAPGVLLTGAAGTGKSRLAREALARAAGEGIETLLTVCTRATSSIPFAALSALAGAGQGDDRYGHIMSLLRAREQRPVLVLDDVDRLDRMSMAVVHQAAGENLVFLIATVRTGQDQDPDVTALWKDLGLVRVEIQPLSRPEIVDMLSGALGGDVDGVAGRELWEASHGIPLYVKELTVEALRRGDLTRVSDVWILTGPPPTPRSLLDLLGTRLETIAESAREILETIGVAETLPREMMLEMATADTIEHLEAAGIIELSGEDYRLTHPLFGEAIRADMTDVRRRQRMTELADRLGDHRTDSPEHLIRVASWRLEAGADDSPEIFDKAAHAAYRAGDFDLARRLAEHAHDRGSIDGSLLLGQILHETGRHEDAEEINRAIGHPDDERAAVQRAVNLFFGLGRGDEALEVLSQGPAELVYNRAWFLLNIGRIREAAELMESHQSDGPASNVTTAWIMAMAGRPDRALEILERYEAHPTAQEAPGRFRDFPDLPRALALAELGHLAGALEIARKGLEDSIDRHPSFIRSWWLFVLGRVHTDSGVMTSAASVLHQGAVLQQQMFQPGLMRWYLGASAYALAQTTESEKAGELIAHAGLLGDRDERLFDHLTEAAGMWVDAKRSRTSAAAEGLVRLGDDRAALGAFSTARRLWFDAVRLGGSNLVEERLEDGSSDLDRARAGLAVAHRDHDSSLASETAGFFDEIGAHLWAAEAWTTAAGMHFRANEQRPAAAAARRADAARARCQQADTPGLTTERVVVPLSERERQVVTLAARGMPSKEIAAELFVSVKTVNNQIHRAYRKLGVASRSEAAFALGIEIDE